MNLRGFKKKTKEVIKISAICLKNLCKSYGKSQILKGINLNIKKGEFYTLMGPNGSGKSTLVSIIACTNLPTSGNLEVYGYDAVEEAKYIKPLIGYVPQSNFSSSYLTGRENLRYFATLFGFSKSETTVIVDNLLMRMGLSEDAEKRVSNYSGGMRKRLEVATALLPRIKILILDEPTTGLDPSVRKNFLSLIKKINEEDKVTIFLITHIGEDAQIASKVGFMDNGQIVLEGDPENLREKSGLKNVINIEIPLVNGKLSKLLKSLGNDGQVYETENGFKIFSENPEAKLPLLIKELNQVGCKASRIEISSPTLEDIFYKLTSESMRRSSL